jgi:nucleotide-binding universal stress UspA family protein
MRKEGSFLQWIGLAILFRNHCLAQSGTLLAHLSIENGDEEDKNDRKQKKETTMLPLGTILHPTDFSEHSEFAFRVACALARDYKARLILLHVLTPPMMVYGGEPVLAETWPSVKEVEEKLRQLQNQAHHVRAEIQVLEGDPVDMILRAAEETHSDVIVMGTHGRTGLGRLLLGSVAESVIRKAPCPVLSAKPSPARQKALEESETKGEAGTAAGAPK